MQPLKEVTLERIYSAPMEAVWQAWTDPEMLKQWWGPDNVTIPECELELQVGGKFYIVMEAGEAMGPYKGIKWPMLAEFTAVESKSKLVYNITNLSYSTLFYEDRNLIKALTIRRLNGILQSQILTRSENKAEARLPPPYIRESQKKKAKMEKVLKDLEALDSFDD